MAKKIDEKLQQALLIVEQQKKQQENVDKAIAEIEKICEKYNVVLNVSQPQIQVLPR